MSEKTRLIIVSGLSGSGKSVALHILEDLDFYCIDNLPASFYMVNTLAAALRKNHNNILTRHNEISANGNGVRQS